MTPQHNNRGGRSDKGEAATGSGGTARGSLKEHSPDRPTAGDHTKSTRFHAIVNTLCELSDFRAILTEWLAEQGAHESVIADIVLVVDEAVVNAIKYASSPAEVIATVGQNLVVATIADQGPGLETTKVQAETSERRCGRDSATTNVSEPSSYAQRAERSKTTGGRGLAIIRAIADEFRISSSPEGTTVTISHHLRSDPSTRSPQVGALQDGMDL